MTLATAISRLKLRKWLEPSRALGVKIDWVSTDCFGCGDLRWIESLGDQIQNHTLGE